MRISWPLILVSSLWHTPVCSMALAATAAQNDVAQDTMKSVTIDIERYLIPAKDLPDLNKTEGATGYFSLDSKYPVLQLEPGTNYTIADTPTSTKRSGTLTKRSGSHSFYAWNEHFCGAVVEAYLDNFGCLGDEGICVSWGNQALSIELTQAVPLSPSPSALVFSSSNCHGLTQGITLEGLTSCTNSEIEGIHSALLFYNC